MRRMRLKSLQKRSRLSRAAVNCLGLRLRLCRRLGQRWLLSDRLWSPVFARLTTHRLIARVICSHRRKVRRGGASYTLSASVCAARSLFIADAARRR